MLNYGTFHHKSFFVHFFIAFLPLVALGLKAQEPDNMQEQAVFSADVPPGKVAITKPVEIPGAALSVLRDTLGRGRVNCIKNANGISPEHVPASWFVGSEIHLDGPDEADLVVLPKDFHESPAPNRCLMGANVEPFWVLRHVGERYELLLETDSLELRILDSRTDGYRDIEAGAGTAVSCTTLVFKMDVAQYQIAEKKTKP